MEIFSSSSKPPVEKPLLHTLADFGLWAEELAAAKRELVMFFDEGDTFFNTASDSLKASFLSTLRDLKATSACPKGRVLLFF